MLDGGITAQLDFAAGAHHAMPRQPERTVQSPRDLPRGAGKSGGAANSAVSGDFTVRNCPNGGEDSLAHYGFVSGGFRRHQTVHRFAIQLARRSSLIDVRERKIDREKPAQGACTIAHDRGEPNLPAYPIGHPLANFQRTITVQETAPADADNCRSWAAQRYPHYVFQEFLRPLVEGMSQR